MLHLCVQLDYIKAKCLQEENCILMDDVLELADVIVDSGFEGVLIWILRLIGVLAILAGLGLWLFTEMGLLVLPLGLIVGGLVLLIVPGLLLTLVELLE
jgi:hypothetical protein